MLHPFMGIESWDKTGMSVAESAERLRRIGYFDRQAMRIGAGRMIACPEYEIKGLLARMAWQDSVHHDQMRSRCKQLRMSSSAFDKCPEPGYERLMETVLSSADTLQLLVALFEVVKPGQIRAIRDYMELAQPIVDQPSIHMLRHQMLDREDELEWGRQAIAALSESADAERLQAATQWKSYIAGLLAAAGGADGKGLSTAAPVDEPSGIMPFKLPAHSPRDSRYTSAVTKFKDISFPDSDEGRFTMMMYSRYFEMSPAEGVAFVLFETKGKPWAFYLDTARHLWDEVRHSWFGEAALRSKGFDVYEAPNWIGFYEVSRNLFGPEEAYVHLTVAIEQAAMKYPPGKREEWEFARDIAKDPLMTTFQDFDWADEVVHAGFGKKWVVDTQYNGDAEAARKDADETWVKRNRFMEEQAAGKPEPPSPFAGNY